MQLTKKSNWVPRWITSGQESFPLFRSTLDNMRTMMQYFLFYHNRQNCRKRSVEECISDYIALNSERRFNKNSLLRSYFFSVRLGLLSLVPKFFAVSGDWITITSEFSLLFFLSSFFLLLHCIFIIYRGLRNFCARLLYRYQLKAVRAGVLMLSRENGEFCHGKVGR